MNKASGVCVVDATLRDGGLVNDFYFADDFARAVYRANAAAGVDYMEFGYRADKKLFDPEKFGKWKFSSDDDIRAVVGEKNGGPKISVMVDVGRCDCDDIHLRRESPVDMIRVATYIDTIPQAIKIIEHADKMGYETACNLMGVSQYGEKELVEVMKILSESPVSGGYIVDSFGALYPEQIGRIVGIYSEIMRPAGKRVGIHAHNNQQCAFANTLEAMKSGAIMLDATAYGMGRGAGNCHLEALLGYLRGVKYRIEPILDLVRAELLPMRENGMVWGYNTSYLLTGLANRHPRTAIEATKNNNTDFALQYEELTNEKNPS